MVTDIKTYWQNSQHTRRIWVLDQIGLRIYDKQTKSLAKKGWDRLPIKIQNTLVEKWNNDNITV